MAFRSTWSPNFDCLVRAGNQGIAYGSSTLAVWARLDDTAASYEAIEINNSNGTAFFTSAITVFSGNWAFHSTNSAGTRVSYNGTAVSTNTWTHLALTFDGTTMRSYINGVEVDNRAGPAGPFGNWADVQIGPALGYLQDGLFFSRALSAGEIQQLYAARRPKCSTANLEYWAPCFPGSGRVDDYSGNNRDFSNGGTPTDPGSTIPLPPVGWGGSRARIILPQGSAVSGSGDGKTVFNGAGTPTVAVAATADGKTRFNGAGTPTVAVSDSGAGGIILNASGVPTIAVAPTADGKTAFGGSGTASVAVAAAGDGRTVFNGLGNAGGAGEGKTLFGGSGTPTISIAAAGGGGTVFNGSGSGSTGAGGRRVLTNPGARRSSVLYGTRRRLR